MHEMNVPCAVVKNIKEVLEQEKAQRLIKTEKTQGEDTSRITSIGFARSRNKEDYIYIHEH